MRHLFSPEGETALRATLQRRPLLAFDFDGTLAPIVARPEDARMPTEVAERLAALKLRLPTAIVTGRRVADVQARLGFEPHFVVGSHGAEDPGDPDTALPLVQALQGLRQDLQGRQAALQTAGVTVEDKGPSIALHYRQSKTPERALELIDELMRAHDASLRVFGGKCVVNITSQAAPDKAHAVHRLAIRAGASCAIFAGDDVNDEPVFASAPDDWLTLRVGPEEPASQAQFRVDGPAEMALLLERMLLLLPPPAA